MVRRLLSGAAAIAAVVAGAVVVNTATTQTPTCVISETRDSLTVRCAVPTRVDTLRLVDTVFATPVPPDTTAERPEEPSTPPPAPPPPAPAPPPPSPPAQGVWIQEDFSGYSSTADLLRYPNPTWTGPSEDVNTNRISLDTDAPPVGGKSMRYDFPNRSGDARFCHDYTIGRNIRLPAEVTEVWVEAWIKFEPVFETLVPSCLSTSGNAYKTFFVRVRRNGAFTFVIGTNGPGRNYTIQRPAFSDAYHGRGPSGMQYADLVNGQWHLLQQHVRSGQNGLIETRIDGIKIQSASGFFDGGNIYALALGRNMNQGPDHPQSLWWGRVRAWNRDPGWGW